MPPIERCIGCHGNFTAAATALAAPAIPWSVDQQRPFEVRWMRVYTLPDFVRFAHEPHIHAGIECASCHGPVETMDRVVPVHEINMGFCLNCHFEKKVRTDCSVCHY